MRKIYYKNSNFRLEIRQARSPDARKIVLESENFPEAAVQKRNAWDAFDGTGQGSDCALSF
jgi:hypothetical protein